MVEGTKRGCYVSVGIAQIARILKSLFCKALENKQESTAQ